MKEDNETIRDENTGCYLPPPNLDSSGGGGINSAVQPGARVATCRICIPHGSDTFEEVSFLADMCI